MHDAPILVAGGAGFIGSALVRHLVLERGIPVVNVDTRSLGGHPRSLGEAATSPLHRFERADIANPGAVEAIFRRHQPRAVFHLAAEWRADRAVDAPATFVHANVVGTFTLLEQATRFWNARIAEHRHTVRFVHVSTDDAFESRAGELVTGAPCHPDAAVAVARAASERFARSWHRLHGLPVVVTNAPATYGAYQHPERVIPATVRRALAGDAIPAPGSWRQRHDWLHVDDHVRGLVAALEQGTPGEAYRFGAATARTTLEVVLAVCDAVDAIAPAGFPRRRLVAPVDDRPGHGARQAPHRSPTNEPPGWAPRHAFDPGLRETVAWYARNGAWVDEVLAGRDAGHRVAPGASQGATARIRHVAETVVQVGTTDRRAVA